MPVLSSLLREQIAHWMSLQTLADVEIEEVPVILDSQCLCHKTLIYDPGLHVFI